MSAHSPQLALLRHQGGGDSSLLEACLDVAAAASFVEVERRLSQWLPRLFRSTWWSVTWLDQPNGAPLTHLRSAQPHTAPHSAGHDRALTLPLMVRGSLHGALVIHVAHEHGLGTQRVGDLNQLTSVLARNLQRIQHALQSVTQSAEVFFAHAVVQENIAAGTQPHLDRLANSLLEHLDLSSFTIVIDPFGTDSLSWGASGRRGAAPFPLEQRRQMLQLAGAVVHQQPRSTEPHVLVRREDILTLAATYSLPSLSAFQALLIVPVVKDGLVIGAVLAGEERAWSRQPLPQPTLSICSMVARTLVNALSHSVLLREVRARTQFVQTFTDGLSEAVIVAQNDVIMVWNQAATTLFGYRADEVRGQPIVAVLPNIPATVVEAFTTPAQRIATSTFQWRMDMAGGHELDLSCVVTQLENVNAGAPLVMFSFKKTTYEPEFSYVKDELLSVISHELRTPLNGINGFGRLLLERPYMTEAMRKDALASLQSSITRLNRMANDFIDVARAQRHSLPLEMDDIAVGDVIRSAVQDARQRYSDRQILLRVGKDLPTVHGDSLRIKQILDNLVGNAAKYSDAGMPISVTVRRRTDTIAISVADRGPGIPKAIQARIFEAFYRGTHARMRQVGGVGLGLSLVKSLAEGHHGTVTLRSISGKGSTFTVTLPIARHSNTELLAVA